MGYLGKAAEGRAKRGGSGRVCGLHTVARCQYVYFNVINSQTAGSGMVGLEMVGTPELRGGRGQRARPGQNRNSDVEVVDSGVGCSLDGVQGLLARDLATRSPAAPMYAS